MNLLKGPQRFTEIVGFSERGVQEYFQKFFFKDELFRKRYDSVKTNEILQSLCSVPLLCWMVCCCLRKNFKDDNHELTELKTTTSIYVHFVTTLPKDYCQSGLSLLRIVGWLLEKGRYNFSSAQVDLGLATSLFLYKDDDVRAEGKPVLKFIHFSFQELFTALRYVLLDEEESQSKVREALNDRLLVNLRDRPSVMMFLCALLNEEVSSYLFEKIKWTAPHTVKRNNSNLKKKLMHRISILILRNGFELFALRCLYELQDEEFTRRALLKCVSVDLSYVPLRSTDCWVLLYCLQLCPHIRRVNLMYCELTTDKLKILQPALHMPETLRLTVEHLSTVGDLIQNLDEAEILKELKVQEDENRAESTRWSLDLSVACGDVLVSLSSSEKNPSFPAVLNISLRCPQSQISSTDWTLFLQRLREAGKLSEDSSSPDENVSLLLSSFHSMCLKTLDLKVVSLNESWASGIICLVQTCTSLQQLRASVTGLLLEEGLALLEKSLMDPDCTVIIEGRKCSKPSDQCREQDWSHSCNEKVEIHFKPKVLDKLEGLSISEPEESDLNPHPLPVCESCVHIADSDEWVQVEPSVCRDEAGSEFRIRTPAGRFECSRTTLRWVCLNEVSLQYHAVDGGFLNVELERLQFERIGPVIDVTVISGKLEEAHLPHYICLSESDSSLTDAVKLLSVEHEGFIMESVELTRFHAKILQPNFSPKTLLIKLGMPVKVHCDLLIFMTQNKPIILHVYFFPSDSLFKEKIKTEEKSNRQIKCSRPETPLQMMKQHSLEVTGADVQPKAIKLRGDIQPNFFQVRQPVVDNFHMTLSRVDDQKSVWTATIWKELTTIKSNNPESNVCQTGQKHNTQVAHNFDKATFFDTNWCHLIQSVKNVNAIADKLLQKEIIHEELYSQITHPNLTNEDSMRKICSSVRKGSVNVKDIFISILLEETPNLLNHLPLSDS